jgi:uncharacterized phage-associated protein
MATVYDVAEAIVQRVPDARRDWMRLQKLVYYAQAWSLVWDDRPLFGDQIEAWKDGPVVAKLYGAMKHEGGFAGDPSVLDAAAHETIDAVVSAYGQKPAAWLSELTHREAPWVAARGGLPPSARSKAPIDQKVIRACYAAQGLKSKLLPEAYMRGLEVLVETPEDEVELLLNSDPQPGEAYLNWLEKGDEWPEGS